MSEQERDKKVTEAVVWMICFVASVLDPKKENDAIAHAALNADTMTEEFYKRFPVEIFLEP